MDVTEQKELEEQLRQAQKMDAIGKLAGGIAHDFNNLLTAILGFGNVLLETIGEDDPRRTHVEQILKAGQRAADLTSQLLAFSRQQLLQPVIVDLNQIVDDSVVLLRRLIGENIRLETVLAPQIATVRADPVQLQQVLMNLSINARDAMPDGGRLTIEIANVELDENYGGHHYAVASGKYVLLAVSDTGVGMTETVRARLFEPFFTTKKRGEGTGLGLATVYGAVKQAGGYIWVYGEPGKGSTFKVYLPRVEGESTAAVAAAVTAVPASGSETILLVEDEPAVRQLARMMLERAGYRVVEAGTAEEAETTHLAHVGSIRLLITDVVLPGSSGPDLFQRLSIRDPKLKVLYMSGYTDDAVFRTGRLQHGVAFVQKPFTADTLRKKTREVLDS
jgi:two-component system cell cycle sensor histidine kinase/response regulator CckA